MALRAARSGFPNRTWTSKRDKRAWSKSCGRFVAPSRIIFPFDSMPSTWNVFSSILQHLFNQITQTDPFKQTFRSKTDSNRRVASCVCSLRSCARASISSTNTIAPFSNLFSWFFFQIKVKCDKYRYAECYYELVLAWIPCASFQETSKLLFPFAIVFWHNCFCGHID